MKYTEIINERIRTFYKFVLLYNASKIDTLFDGNYDDYYNALSNYLTERRNYKEYGIESSEERHKKIFSDIAKFNSCFIKREYIQAIFGKLPITNKKVPYAKYIKAMLESKHIILAHKHCEGYTLNPADKSRHPLANHYMIPYTKMKKLFDSGDVKDVLDLNSSLYLPRERKLFKKLFMKMGITK